MPFLIKMEAVELRRKTPRLEDLGNRTFLAFRNVIENSIDLEGIPVTGDILRDIKKNIIDDELNKDLTFPEASDLNHVISGRLLASVRQEVEFDRVAGTTEILFGYFVPYGLNLEEGNSDGSSNPFPIIVPIWENGKESVKQEIFKEVKNNFKTRLREFTGNSSN